MPQSYWLLSHEALQLRAARELRGPIVARVAAPQAGEALPPPLTIENGVATIRVEGVLTPTPDAESAWYGDPNTTYPDLQAALSAALADNSVGEIVWSVDSPGGAVDGLFALLDDIAQARASGGKPMRVQAQNAHSAAYGIAAAAGPITADSRMASFGSVGVATSSFLLGEVIGKVVHLTNTDAPDKRPDLATPEGRAVITAYLDQIASEFMGVIARGRGVAVGDVASGYGRGASMLAPAALAARLIDGISARPASGVRTHLTDARTADIVPDRMSSNDTAPQGVAQEVETPAEAAALVVPVVPGLTEAERAELAELRAERDARIAADRRALVTELIALGAETPATAWIDNAPAPRLATEPLDSIRARVAALRAAKPSADIRPPAVAEFDGLSEVEAAQAAKIKDPEHRARFIARRRERAAARAGTERLS